MSSGAGEALLVWGQGDPSELVVHSRRTPSSLARTLCHPGPLLTRTPHWLVPFTDLSPHRTRPVLWAGTPLLAGQYRGENREQVCRPLSSASSLPTVVQTRVGEQTASRSAQGSSDPTGLRQLQEGV